MHNMFQCLTPVLLAITLSTTVLGTQAQAGGLAVGVGEWAGNVQQVQFRQGHGTPTRSRDVLRAPTTGLNNCSKTCAPGMDANGNACTNCVVVCDHGKGEATVHQWCLAAPTSGGN